MLPFHKNYLFKQNYLLLLSLLLVLFISSPALSQVDRKSDVILFKNGKTLDVIITEVTDAIVKYKKKNDPDGPVFTVKKSDILSVSYGNGDKEVYNKKTNPSLSSGGWDVIESKKKGPINGKVVEISKNFVAYRKNRNKESMVYSIKKSDVTRIVFSNGDIDNLDGPPRKIKPSPIVINDNIDYLSGDQPVAKNEFQAEMMRLPTGELLPRYDRYRSKSNGGKVGGVFWTTIAVAAPIAGIIMLNGYNEDVQGAGALLLIGGPLIGGTLATVSWSNAVRNANKARFISKELTRRGQPVSLQFSPQLNLQNNSAGLSVRMVF